MNSKRELNLPLGFVFSPTDEELVGSYLIPKLKGEKPPSDYVIDLENVYRYHPTNLPYRLKYGRENEAFFFTNDDLGRNSGDQEGQIRATPGGFWKVHKDNVAIYGGGEVVGFKTKLFFYDSASGSRTEWKMNQFRIAATTSTNMENRIICKIKLKEVEDLD